MPLLLAALYAGRVLGQPLDAATLAAWSAVSAGWAEAAVHPLRQVRRALKAPPPPFGGGEVAALRETVKAAELAAERLQLAVLAGLMPPGAGTWSAAVAAANLRGCLDRLPGFHADRDNPAIAAILSQV